MRRAVGRSCAIREGTVRIRRTAFIRLAGSPVSCRALATGDNPFLSQTTSFFGHPGSRSLGLSFKLTRFLIVEVREQLLRQLNEGIAGQIPLRGYSTQNLDCRFMASGRGESIKCRKQLL